MSACHMWGWNVTTPRDAVLGKPGVQHSLLVPPVVEPAHDVQALACLPLQLPVSAGKVAGGADLYDCPAWMR
jgi:hypothetical protein